MSKIGTLLRIRLPIDPDSLASTLLCLVGDHIAFADSVSHYFTSEKTRISKVWIEELSKEMSPEHENTGSVTLTVGRDRRWNS